MQVRRPLLATMLGIGVAYAAYPYVTLYRLGAAIQAADTGTLESLINWPAVREGIKEDVADLVADDPNATTGNELPPFGASFVRGITSGAIDRAVTPQALLAATVTVPPNQTPAHGAAVHVDWAFFDSATTFLISLRAQGQTDPIRLEMDLRHGEWRVYRVWLPAELLSPGSPT